jgi:hypothetical protein
MPKGTARPLARPEFGVVPPEAVEKSRYTGPPFRYKANLDIAREHPGVGCKIGFFRHPKVSETARVSSQHKCQVRAWLDKNHPLERWELAVRRDFDTWADRYLWATYLGPWTEEERAADMERRLKEYEQKWGTAEQRRANREAREVQQRLRERAEQDPEAPEG